MRVKFKKKCYLKRRLEPVKSNEGITITAYSEPIELIAHIYPASGRLQAELYGERLNYIYNMLYDGPEDINEGDIICYALTDYKVISVKEYSHKVIELEKIL